MESKQIRIDVDQRVPRVSLDMLHDLQGSLKTISNENLEKLRKSILEHGFFAPVFAWRTGNGMKLIDGHQRVRVLTELQKDGYLIPKIPVVEISAKNEKDAREKLLLTTSQFGHIQKSGLHEFLVLSEISPEIFVEKFDFQSVDSDKFVEQFYYPKQEIKPLAPTADLKSIGGNATKTLAVHFTEEQHQEVLRMLGELQRFYETENAAETIFAALKAQIEAIEK